MIVQDRDRWMQVFLTQARGAVRNGDHLRQAVDRTLRIRASRDSEKIAFMDDALIEMLSSVADALDAASVTYAVTGSIASSVHGEPFASLDADIILIASRAQAGEIALSLQPRFYAPPDMLMEAAGRGSFANVVDNRTGLKVDFSFVSGDEFLQSVLRRRVLLPIGSHSRAFWFVTPEDVILMKLLWRKATQSAKQWENVLGVARVRGARMDWGYLMETARRLDIEQDLTRLRDQARI